MSNTWRCPECETINEAEKCIICGTLYTENNKLIDKYKKDFTFIDNDHSDIISQNHKFESKHKNKVTPKKHFLVSRILLLILVVILVLFIILNDVLNLNIINEMTWKSIILIAELILVIYIYISWR